MKLIIDLIYNGTRIDARQLELPNPRNRQQTIRVDITRLVDQRIGDQVARHLAKLTNATKLVKKIRSA